MLWPFFRQIIFKCKQTVAMEIRVDTRLDF
jgi:hypothetical protein